MNEPVGVVVCSHLESRWEQLLAAVSSLEAQALPCAQIVVVVDGDAGLGSRALRELAHRCEVVVRPERGGLSRARNDGLARIWTPLVAFLDDDARAEPDWLQELVGHLDDDVIGVGGRSVPQWQSEAPTWLPDELLWAVGCSYTGLPASAASVRNVYGGCALYRTAVFAAVGGFHHSLGRTAGPLAEGGEETELCIRAAHALEGARFVYAPSAVIHHWVPDSRLQVGYLARRAFAEGRSKAKLRRLTADARALDTERRYLRAVAAPAIASRIARAARGDAAGLAGAAALALAVGAAALGFVEGMARSKRITAEPAPHLGDLGAAAS